MSLILLLRPPSVFHKNSYSSPVTMPLALAYLAANLLKRGHQVQCLDALGEDIQHIGVAHLNSLRYRGLSIANILARIDQRPDGIAVSAMFSQEWPYCELLIRKIHEKYPDVPIIVGGEHATALPEFILQTCAAVTFIGAGEGEETIVDFADFLEAKIKAEHISGIWRRNTAGTPIKNISRPRIKHLDEIPKPAWNLFQLEPYLQMGEGCGAYRGRTMPILATRGCPYQCTFCSNPTMWQTKYYMRDVKKVADEIEEYLQVYKVNNIDFYDLTAIVKRDWILDFCQEIKNRGLNFTWQLPSGTRSEALDAEVLQALASNGCMNITYAPESGSVETLKAIKKKIKLPRMFDSIRMAKRNGIVVKCNLIIGFPTETRLDVWKTLWCALRLVFLGVDDIGLYPFSPYPGSELYEYLRKKSVIRSLDAQYFESLTAYMNVKQPLNYSENIGVRELAFYHHAGMAIAYGLGYLLFPSRVLRSIRNYKTGRSDTAFEERLFSVLRRRKLERARIQRDSNASIFT